MLARIIFVSVTGALDYRFVMSNEGRVKCCSMGVILTFCKRPRVFFMLKALRSGAMWLIVLVNSFDRLYAGALRQFTTGRIGWSGLCIFISSLMEGAEGFMLMYFHLLSFGIKDHISECNL